MQAVITAAESRRLDSETTIPLDLLMDRAGGAVALAAVEMGATYGRRVAVLAGKGSNGGDGYVAARRLRQRGVAVEVHALASPDPESTAGRAAVDARRSGVRIVPLGSPVPADLVIDALFGSGFRGVLPAVVHPWLDDNAPVLSVDLPSGLDADDGTVGGRAFTARRCVALHARKVGHLLGEGPDRSGVVSVADIGLSGERAELSIIDAGDAVLPSRDRTSHKWAAGSVLVVGGAPGMSGAPLLAAQAALRFGAGAVRCVVPGSVVDRVAAPAPEIMVSAVGAQQFGAADAPEVAAMQDRFQVLVLGPGIGRGSDAFVNSLIDLWPGPRVVDADALAAVAGIDELDGTDTIITPHAGEWRRLTNTEPTYVAARGIAAGRALTIVLKGAPTFVVRDHVHAVTSGGPELATIGTGDVLAGMVGALLARGLDTAAAGWAAAYWHGVAGAGLSRRGTVTADRLLDEIVRFAW